MASFTHSSRFAILALALTLVTPLNVSAQSSRPSSSSLGSVLGNSFRPPTRGLPSNRIGGASRGGCFVNGNDADNSNVTRHLTALVPVGAGETAAEYATVFWYMPKMSDIEDGKPGAAPAPEMEFTLRDASGQKIYSANYPLTKYSDGSVGIPGIMSLTLPTPLQVGQEYKWELRARCDAKSPDRSSDKTVEGGIKRVAQDPELELRVQQASAEERIMLYAQANRWYEMLANLVALRRERPNDPTLTDAWNKLFAGVELDTVTIQSRSQGAGNTNN